MIKSNGGIIGPDNVTTGGAFGSASGVFKLGEVTNLIKDSKWPTAGPQGYQVANSCRFNSGSSDTLNRNPSGASNRKTYTISFWVKRAKIGSRQSIFNNTDGSGQDGVYFDFQADDTFLFNDYGTGAYLTPRFETTQVFRDTSAWYHIVYAVDTTQGTESNRVKIYVNGNQVTNFDVANYPSLNQDTLWNRTDMIYIGTYTAGGNYLGAYLSEVINIDGLQLDPTSFGEFNSQTGIWVPKSVTGLTFGTNGFYLPFTNASALGEDFSGEDNDFTVNNLTSLDQSTDTCSTNFATLMHPGYDDAGNVWQNILSEGNLFGASTSGGYSNYIGTIGLSTGKWYWETKVTLSAATNANSGTGIKSAEYTQRSAWQSGSGSYYFSTTGDIGNATTPGTSYGSAISSGNIVGVAYDATNGVIWFSINGTWQNSATISEIEAGTTTNAAFSSIASGTYLPFGTDATGSRTFDYGFNFGSPFYAISSGNTDGNGFGNFEYSVPSGYLSINTKNLAAVLA